MSNMQTTSLDAYLTMVIKGLATSQSAVIGVFKHYPTEAFTNAELALMLGWSINRVTPRVLELRKLGILEEHEKRFSAMDHKSKRSIAWKIALEKKRFYDEIKEGN